MLSLSPVRPSRTRLLHDAARRRAPRRAAWIAPRLALGLLGSLAACGSDHGAEPRSGGPTLLLVTLDTTRADRLGSYGQAQAGTPELDALAAEGVRFERAYTVAPLTLPAHSSILTGLVPPVHGVRDNGSFGLPQSATTLAERLAAVGWRTGAFVAAFPLKAIFGLAQGFEVYDDRFERKLSGSAYAERPAEQVLASATAWLRQLEADEPAFLWVHLFDPHRPWVAGGADEAAYQAEIQHVDRQLGQLLETLQALGRREALHVLVVGDHGEGLGQHGEPSHAQLVYDSTLRVPLILSGPGVPRAEVVSTPVSVVDVTPTLLAALELAPLGEAQGRDLAPAWSGAGLAPRAVYAESLYPELHHGWSRLNALVEGDEKLILAPGAAQRVELFDVARDPEELNDLAPTRALDAARFADRLRRWLDELPAPLAGGAAREADEDTLAQLAALGYVAPAPRPDERGRHPAEMIDLVTALEEGRSAANAGRLGLARKQLRFLEEREPGGLAALELAADIALVASAQDPAELERAAELYLAATARAPQSKKPWRTLSEVQERLGRPLEALLSLERVLELAPGTPKLLARHAELLEAVRSEARRLAELGQREASATLFAALSARLPDDVEAAAGAR